MTFKKLNPPDSASEAATSRLSSLERARGRIPDNEAGGGTLANPEQCLPVYYLDGASWTKDSAAATKENLSLSTAYLVGWRYLVGKGENAKSVEVINDVAVAVDGGQIAIDIKSALDTAQVALSHSDYEPRMLTFGRLANPVLWLHPENSSAERFFSLGPKSDELPYERILDDVLASALARQDGWVTARDSPDDESGG